MYKIKKKTAKNEILAHRTLQLLFYSKNSSTVYYTEAKNTSITEFQAQTRESQLLHNEKRYRLAAPTGQNRVNATKTCIVTLLTIQLQIL